MGVSMGGTDVPEWTVTRLKCQVVDGGLEVRVLGIDHQLDSLVYRL